MAQNRKLSPSEAFAAGHGSPDIRAMDQAEATDEKVVPKRQVWPGGSVGGVPKFNPANVARVERGEWLYVGNEVSYMEEEVVVLEIDAPNDRAYVEYEDASCDWVALSELSEG